MSAQPLSIESTAPLPQPSSSTTSPAPPPVDSSHPLAAASTAAMPPPLTSTDPEIQLLPLPRNSGGSEPGRGTITPPTPMVHLRILVISGQSHPFSFEPETTVGRMKELVWSMWPSDWTSPAQPPSPSFLRILYAGRILGDDTTLESNGLPASLQSKNPTVMHISVRSFSIRAEDDAKKPSLLHPTHSRTSRNQAGGDEVGGCKCVIM